MFKKLISNLPFNPSLYDQVSFYAARMRADTSLRRAGFLFMAMAFAVQLTAAMYPAEKSLASSSNNILNGITNKSSILSAWDANTGNIQDIYGKFGITRANIADISGENPNSTVVSSAGNNYWSIGRQPLSNFGISSSKWGERTVSAGSTTVYQRPLHAWDSGESTSYKAFKGTNKYGATFWIMQTCGNATFSGAYLPSPPTPKIAVHKTLLTGATAKPGDTVKYRLEYQNAVPDSLASGFQLTDSLNDSLEFVSLTNMASHYGDKLIITNGGSLGYTPNAYTATLVAKVKSTAKAGAYICNSANASWSGGSASSPEAPCFTVVASTNQVCLPLDSGKIDVSGSHPTLNIKAPAGYLIYKYCVKAGSINQGLGPEYVDVNPNSNTVTIRHSSGKDISHYSYAKVKQSNPAPTPSPTPAPAPSPTPSPSPTAPPPTTPPATPPIEFYCVATTSFVSGSNRDFVLTTQAYASQALSVSAYKYSYDVDGNGSVEYTDTTKDNPHLRTLTGLPNGSHVLAVKVEAVNPDGKVYHSNSCKTVVNIAEEARVVMSKTVTNISRGSSNADGTTVKSGDELEFKLKTENVTTSDYQNYKGQDYFGSVLQYADIADRSQLATQGIALDSSGNLSWTAANIKAGASDVKTIRVKVKEIIPVTNKPSSVSPDYNCKISNSYGNEVTMSVDCPIVKQLAESATALPSTGPGTSVMIGTIITVLAGYLFARSRLISRELALVRQNYISAGGE